MKLVYVIPFMRVPPDFGLAIRDYHLLNYLAEHHSVILMSFETPHQGEFADWARGKMTEFVSLGTYPTTPKQPTRLGFPRRLMGWGPSALSRVQPRPMATQVRHILDKHPDIALIVFDTHLTAQAALYLKPPLPSTVAVLLDISSVYARRQFEQTAWRPYKLVYALDWLKINRYERRILNCFDYLVTMSENDARMAKRFAPRAQVMVSPNGVDTAYFKPRSTPHSGKNLIFVGNFGYEPNPDAFFFLIDRVLPRVRAKYPDVTLTAVGLNPTDEMRRAAESDSRIRVTGQVPDVRPYYAQADVAVVPLRVGSGVKLKVLEAMSMGVPVVTTRVGCEGIDARAGEHMLVADRPEDFAQAILDLLDSNGNNTMLTAEARTLAENYDWMTIARDLEANLMRIARTDPYSSQRSGGKDSAQDPVASNPPIS